MQIFEDAAGYANYSNAVKALDKALAKIGRSRDNVRWLIAVNGAGRFIPTVQFRNGDSDLMALAHIGIGLI